MYSRFEIETAMTNISLLRLLGRYHSVFRFSSKDMRFAIHSKLTYIWDLVDLVARVST